MRKLFLLLASFTITSNYAQVKSAYILSEKIELVQIDSTIITYDSVFVTSPDGLTLKYALSSILTNTSLHDGQFSIILNEIIDLGYNNISNESWNNPMQVNTPQGNFIVRTMFLYKMPNR